MLAITYIAHIWLLLVGQGELVAYLKLSGLIPLTLVRQFSIQRNAKHLLDKEIHSGFLCPENSPTKEERKPRTLMRGEF